MREGLEVRWVLSSGAGRAETIEVVHVGRFEPLSGRTSNATVAFAPWVRCEELRSGLLPPLVVAPLAGAGPLTVGETPAREGVGWAAVSELERAAGVGARGWDELGAAVVAAGLESRCPHQTLDGLMRGTAVGALRAHDG